MSAVQNDLKVKNSKPDAKLDEARRAAYAMPLEDMDVSLGERYADDTIWPYFERLRDEDPVHYCAESEFGPYWSITRFDDIMFVEQNHELFSSERGITIVERPESTLQTRSFISMDPPEHDVQRNTVVPVVAPRNLAALEGTIRERAAKILDSLPPPDEKNDKTEPFNWVDLVSIELTTQMLATLFDFPFERRHKLTYWSDLVTNGIAETGLTQEERTNELLDCLSVFTELWNERVNEPPRTDLISMLAHGESTKNMQPMEFLGNLILLIVGGNDTTRNSISGGVLALNQNPAEYAKLREDHSLIPNMVSEIIRWQTPLAHMRRRCVKDTEVGGKLIRKGDKVVMWYISGNRDERRIERPDEFLIDRANPRNHVSFGFGIHRCMGNRLAEMQLRVLWEEIVKRFSFVEVVGKPVRTSSSFVHGFTELPVRLHA